MNIDNKTNSKMVIVMRADLNMRKGKMIAQGSHAVLGVILDMMKKEETNNTINLKLVVNKYSDLDNWINGIFTKVTVKVNSDEELLEIYNKALESNLPVKLITDNGLTEFHGVKTNTCIAIGPANSEVIDKITGHLKLL